MEPHDHHKARSTNRGNAYAGAKRNSQPPIQEPPPQDELPDTMLPRPGEPWAPSLAFAPMGKASKEQGKIVGQLSAALSLAVKAIGANGQTRGMRLFYEGVAPGQKRLKIVQTAQNPVEIARLLVLDIGLPGSLIGLLLAARLIFRAAGLRVRRAALGIVLGLANRLLGDTFGLKLFTGRTGEKPNPKREQSGQDQGFSDHWPLLELE